MIFKYFSLQVQKILNLLDSQLDKLTSYRLILYSLYSILAYSLVLSIQGKLIFTWQQLIISTVGLIIVCRVSNIIYSYYFSVPHNKESDLITALILALILSPATGIYSAAALIAAGFAAMSAKYILTLGGRHIFNPAALGAFIAGAIFHNYASWWVGNSHLTPLIVVAGIIVLRKIKRFQMVGLFIAIDLVYIATSRGLSSPVLGHYLWFGLTGTALLFFATIMLTEPLTSPTEHDQTILYAGLVGGLYAITVFRISPEQALLAGNILTYALAPQRRLTLALVDKIKEAESIYSFVFKSDHQPKFQPGQYMEFTLPRTKSDSRGNRRYLTISSAPSETNLMFTLKIPTKPSSFKSSLLSMKLGDKILAAQTAGHFTLPSTNTRPMIFIAGGVGITPFRSVIKQLLATDKQPGQPMTLLYSANSPKELAFLGLFKQASVIGLKTVCTVTGPTPNNWQGETGPINEALVTKYVPDYKNCLVYVSGPQAFVAAVRQSLIEAGLNHKQLITDFFPGYG